jgi:hypothetical protein
MAVADKSRTLNNLKHKYSEKRRQNIDKITQILDATTIGKKENQENKIVTRGG